MYEDKRRNILHKNDGKSFSLGSLPHHLGLIGSDKQYDKYSDKEKEQFKTALDEYLKYIMGSENFTVSDLKDIIGRCEKIRINYRNPAAHTVSIDKTLASECCEEVIGKSEAGENMGEIQGVLLQIMSMIKVDYSEIIYS